MSMRVVGGPGNPVSSYVCTFLFVVPLIRALSGRRTVQHGRETALLGRDLPTWFVEEPHATPDADAPRPCTMIIVTRADAGDGPSASTG